MTVRFYGKTEAQLRQWVEANPGRVNDTDESKNTLLYAAAYYLKSLPLVLWLLDVTGADVDARLPRGQTLLAETDSFDIFNALLDRGADPTLLDVYGMSLIMHHARYIRGDMVRRLLQDLRVRINVNEQDHWHASCLLAQARTRTHMQMRTGKAPASSAHRLRASSSGSSTNKGTQSPLPPNHPSASPPSCFFPIDAASRKRSTTSAVER